MFIFEEDYEHFILEFSDNLDPVANIIRWEILRKMFTDSPEIQILSDEI